MLKMVKWIYLKKYRVAYFAGDVSDFGREGRLMAKRNYENIALCLLTEPNLTAAAKRAGVSERTLRRYKKTPEFQKVYHEVKGALFGETMERAQAMTLGALETLFEICGNFTYNESARVSAARSILEFGTDAHKVEAIEAEIAKLKERWASETN